VEHTNMPPVTARDIVNVLQPPAPLIESTPFKGRIETIGVGPAGLVAQVHSHLDWDAWVTEKLGARSNNDWITHLKSVEFVDGILDIELDDRPGLHVVWADEGFELGDYQDAGFGWYSADGTDWTQIPYDYVDRRSGGDPGTLPTGFEAIVGVSDGFIAAGDGWMWHSADGLTWRKLAATAEDSLDRSHLLPWKGGALSTDGIRRFDLWTSQGMSDLPMADEVSLPTERYSAVVGTGQLGLVTIMDRPPNEVLFTRDGVDWKIQPTPLLPEAYGTIAVGESSVLYLGWSGSIEEGGFVPHLFVGTVEP
jgi:hypothetical protein